MSEVTEGLAQAHASGGQVHWERVEHSKEWGSEGSNPPRHVVDDGGAHRAVTAHGRQVQRRAAVGVTHVRVRALAHQHGHDGAGALWAVHGSFEGVGW